MEVTSQLEPYDNLSSLRRIMSSREAVKSVFSMLFEENGVVGSIDCPSAGERNRTVATVVTETTDIRSKTEGEYRRQTRPAVRNGARNEDSERGRSVTRDDVRTAES